MTKILAIIPAHNEAATLFDLIYEVKEEYGLHPVVVDDCSVDDTQKVALEAGATVLPLRTQLGAWGAIQTGFRYALKHNFDYAVTLDGDGQHVPSSLPALLEPVTSGNCDVTIGSCPGRCSGSRKAAWALFRRLSGFSLSDLTSGLRAYTPEAMQVLLRPEAYTLDYQDIGVLFLLRSQGIRIREIPVQMRPRTIGSSKIFNNWVQIGRYMFDTTILCISKVVHKKQQTRT